MLDRRSIDAAHYAAQCQRAGLVAAWDASFQDEASDYPDDAVTPFAGEHVNDVWVELPRYGGIVIAARTTAGRILSPWYDPSPHDGECCDGECGNDLDFARDCPDWYLDATVNATEFTHWTEYPTTGIRYWGGE